MPLLDDLWAAGDREAVFQRVLPLMHEAPALFGGPEALRKPFLEEAVKAWDAGELVPRGRAARPIEAALLTALRDLYARWASGLTVAAPPSDGEKIQASAVFDGCAPLDVALLKLAQTGTRFLTPEDAHALSAESGKPLNTILAGLGRAEQARRMKNPDRAKALDRFALARTTGASAEDLAGWAIAGREGGSLTPADIDEGIGWPSGTAGKKIAAARETLIGRLSGAKKP